MKPRDIFMYVAGGLVLLAFLTVTVLANIKGWDVKQDFNSSFLTITALIVGYYWGSSQGSADKTELMNK